ncbi:MAG: hypothetical protein HIU83_07665 [Proteobacteria bacterium]|nr:hypothetical protein [Pseudomonadota bacterium]
MITDYQIVYGHEIWVLQTKVRELLADGWQPFNQLQMSMPVQDDKITPCFAQVMVKVDRIAT